MTLSFGTKVTDRNADPAAVGVVLRLANDAAEYGEEEYVVMWQSGLEELLHRRDLVVVPDPNAMRIVPASDRHSRTRPNHAPGGLVSKDDILTIEITIRRSDLANPAIADSVVGNHVYLLANAIFEWGGEHNRRADGTPVLRCNGHHVAQGLADTVVARWKQHETKTEETP